MKFYIAIGKRGSFIGLELKLFEFDNEKDFKESIKEVQDNYKLFNPPFIAFKGEIIEHKESGGF